MPSQPDLDQSLRQKFGHAAFRDGQREVVEAVFSGRDTFAVMPTGSGKSLCYQLPAVLLDGVTLVVSPLIALMKDQVDDLTARGLPATCIHSALGGAERTRRLRGCRDGEYRLVYVAPERLRSEVFRTALGATRVVRLAIDEAHCISQWGHDFRPDYLRLGALRESLGSPPTLALTATATPPVRADILEQLRLRDPAVFLAGFERPNLRFSVHRTRGVRSKLKAVEAALAEVGGKGIVYASTRRNVEAIASHLAGCGRRAAPYHAGLSSADRVAAQEAFMEGDVEVMVATNAFGMGVDKADIRIVLHHDIPGSLEAYYQEAGRAGRDGEPAECCLLYSFADVRVQEFFLEGANPDREMVEQVLHRLREGLSLDGVAKNDMAVATALNVLERRGLVMRDGEGHPRVTAASGAGSTRMDWPALEEKARRDRERLAAMVRYAEARTCRRRILLGYFTGSPPEGDCGRCDHCQGWHRRSGRLLDEAERRIVRIALSGVARLDDRFGRARLAQMLVGSRAQEVTRFGLEKIPTYGKLSGLPVRSVGELLECLADAGLVRRRELRGTGSLGGAVLSLTREGERVMHDPGADVRLALPDGLTAPRGGPGARKGSSGPLAAGDPALLEALREMRLRRAREQGVPAYVVFHDRTLEAIAAVRPRTLDELQVLPGIGPGKRLRYGQEVLEVVRRVSPPGA